MFACYSKCKISLSRKQSCQCFRFYRKPSILQPSLRLYDCNGKSPDFYARRLSYLLHCVDGGEYNIFSQGNMVPMKTTSISVSYINMANYSTPPRSKSETVIKFKRPKYDKNTKRIM